MTVVDLVVLVWVALAALQGAARGLSTQVVSLFGLAVGGLAASRIVPMFLEGGTKSPWLPVAGLAGAAVGVMLFQLAATLVVPRLGWFLPAPVRLIDAVGGALFGAVVGLAIVWLLAVVALQQPSLGLRKQVQRSEVLPRLVEAVPPRIVLHALGRFDPLPLIGAIPGEGLPPPDPSVARSPQSRLAARAVVKVTGTACGLGLEGSGWVVGRSLVATNAHVIAGERDTRVLVPNGKNLRARPVYVDALNDIALLRVPSLGVAPLRTAPAALRALAQSRFSAIRRTARSSPCLAQRAHPGESSGRTLTAERPRLAGCRAASRTDPARATAAVPRSTGAGGSSR